MKILTLQEAFFEKCEEAKPAKSVYLSLYRESSYYGGPEEGGWWGTDIILVAYQEYATKEAAHSVMVKVEEMVSGMNEDSRKSFDIACAAKCDWLDRYGLDSDYLPGDESYFVVTEDSPGSNARLGSRTYVSWLLNHLR